MRSSQNETQSKPKGVYSIDQILGTHNRQNNNNAMGKTIFSVKFSLINICVGVERCSKS